MPDSEYDRELATRLAAIDVLPYPRWVAELRADLDAAWETGEVPPVVPSVRVARRPPARRRGLQLAFVVGAVCVALVLALVLADTGGVGHRRIQTPARSTPTTIPDIETTRTLVVTPNTGLRDGQIVRVSGRIVANFVTVWICQVGVTPQTAGNDCDGTTGQEVDLQGAPLRSRRLERYPYLVRRTITLGGATVDCAAAPGCVVYAGASTKYGVALVTFDPTATQLPGPTVTVTPRDGLRDGDTVTVRGEHFRPFESVAAGISAGGTDVCDTLDNSLQHADAKGTFSLTRTVWSVFPSDDWVLHDCRAVTCVVGVAVVSGSDTRNRTAVPVSFTPALPSGLPTLTLDAEGPFAEGQQVTATLRGWPPVRGRASYRVQGLSVGQCARFASFGGATMCAGDVQLQGPDSDGSYSATITLQRNVAGNGFAQLQSVDCAEPGNCRVALGVVRNTGDPSTVTLILAIDVVVT